MQSDLLLIVITLKQNSENVSPLPNFVGLPDKTTDDPVAHSAWESSTLDQGHPHVSQAGSMVEPIDHNPPAYL